MANNYFQFKKFIIRQGDAAMKVCTDSCLFGGTLPLCNSADEPIYKVLDIGTGTGLLSLQYAQLNNTATITAIEIDDLAAQQAKQNVAESIFSNRISVETANFLEKHFTQKFDLIICNPPFYEKDLKGVSIRKNWAHHSSMLSLEELFAKTIHLLNDNGIFTILIPSKRIDNVKALCKKYKLTTINEITIHQDERLKSFRTILQVCYSNDSIVEKKSIILIKENGQYTTTFISYLQQFYLHL